MAESTSQQGFFGNAGMHYMAHQSTTSCNETPEDLFHDQHLGLQERMQNLIACHAKMMGDIMYYHQELQQPDAKQFAKAVVKEVNGHFNNKHWELVKQKGSPRRCASHALCMVHAAQAQSHHQQDHQAQGQTESTWWKTSVWNELLRDLSTC